MAFSFEIQYRLIVSFNLVFDVFWPDLVRNRADQIYRFYRRIFFSLFLGNHHNAQGLGEINFELF